MKGKWLVLISGIIVLSIIVGSVNALAQSSNPPDYSMMLGKFDPETPDSRNEHISEVGASHNLETISLGEAGLTYRYAQTFGTTQSFYIEDTSHINFPYGLTTDGTNVWIADTLGMRGLKYDSDGNFVMQIGKAGYRYGTGQSLEYVSDVGVDASGNIWLVDMYASHILKCDSTGNYVSKLGQSYNDGTENDQFSGPRGIAFDDAGNIYVSDSDNHRIQIFSSAGSYLATIGTSGTWGSDNDHFDTPAHITIDSDNLLYAPDIYNHRVQIFNVSNPLSVAYVATLGITGITGSDNAHFNMPNGVAVDASRIYVADESNHRVQVFSRTTRAYQSTIGQGEGNDNAHLRHPTDVAVDMVGNIYIADNFNSRVQQYNSSLAYVRTYGVSGVPYLTTDSMYNQPAGVVVAKDGSIYLTERAGMRLLKLDSVGNIIWSVGQAGMRIDTSESTHFKYPSDVAVSSVGFVYVADAGNDRIQIFSAEGQYAGAIGDGTEGTGNAQLNSPEGLTIAEDGTIYVADTNNERVQIFDDNNNWIATLGVAGEKGTDNAHFNGPNDVAVDSQGNIYVSDSNNFRVQVFNAAHDYVRTIGVTGVEGSDFDYLNGPSYLAVDGNDNLYVSSTWDHLVQGFDSSGAYLTSLGGSRGARTGQLSNPHGLAFDPTGNLYIADFDGARIQKYIQGVTGWKQLNLNGFGERSNQVSSIGIFQNKLYAGSYSYATPNIGPGKIRRLNDDKTWTAVVGNGFGQAHVIGIDDLIEFNGYLYAGSWNEIYSSSTLEGGQVWRSLDGVLWTQVTMPGMDHWNSEILKLVEFNDWLYAGTYSYDPNTHGAEIWRCQQCDGTDWQKVKVFDPWNISVNDFAIVDGYLYAGTANYNSDSAQSNGAEIWRTNNGTTWEAVTLNGFGDTAISYILSLVPFKGYLYASTNYYKESETKSTIVWRCAVENCGTAAGWQQVFTNESWGKGISYINAMQVFGGRLYVAASNRDTGVQIWRTLDGISWEKFLRYDGLGNTNNDKIYSNSDLKSFKGKLVLGLMNSATGGGVWESTTIAENTVDPGAVTNFMLPSSSDGEENSTISIPSGAVTQTMSLVYEELNSSPDTPPQGFSFGGKHFTLQAVIDDELRSQLDFLQPVTIHLIYNDADIAGMDENKLVLLYWDGSSWSDNGITVIERDTAANTLTVTITHLSDFALFASGTIRVYVPLINYLYCGCWINDLNCGCLIYYPNCNCSGW